MSVPSSVMGMPKDSIDIMKASADSAYACEDFATAEQIYLQLIQMGECTDIYYNLGLHYLNTRSHDALG